MNSNITLSLTHVFALSVVTIIYLSGCDNKVATNGSTNAKGTQNAIGSPLKNPIDNREMPKANTQDEVEAKSVGEAIEHAKTLTGGEQQAFLLNYADIHGTAVDFDRLAFLQAVMEIKGPGGELQAIFGSIYSGTKCRSVHELLAEITQLNISEKERELLLNSTFSGMAFHRMSLDELYEIRQLDWGGGISAKLDSLGRNVLPEFLSGKAANEVSDFLSSDPRVKGLILNNSIEAIVTENAKTWMDSIQNSSPDASSVDIIRKYGNEVANGLLKNFSPQEILDPITSENLQFDALVLSVGKRWTGQDANELGEWLSTAVAGRSRDILAAQLSRSLKSRGLNEEAVAWKAFVDDPKIKASIK